MKKISVFVSLIFMSLLHGQETQYKNLNKLHENSIVRHRCGTVQRVRWYKSDLQYACDNLDDKLDELFVKIRIAEKNQKDNIMTQFVGGQLQPDQDFSRS